MICEECNGEYNIGEWPMCQGDSTKHVKTEMGWHTGFTPYVDTQLLQRKDPRCTSVNELGIRGVPIGSRSERNDIMKSEGLQFGTQKFDEKRGKVIYGGSATSEKFKSKQGPQPRKPKKGK